MNKKILMISLLIFLSSMITSFALSFGFENGVLFNDSMVLNTSLFELFAPFSISLIAGILYVAILVYSFYKVVKNSNGMEILKAKAINLKKELIYCYLIVAACVVFVVLFSEYAATLSALISIFIYISIFILIPISVLIFMTILCL